MRKDGRSNYFVFRDMGISTGTIWRGLGKAAAGHGLLRGILVSGSDGNWRDQLVHSECSISKRSRLGADYVNLVSTSLEAGR